MGKAGKSRKRARRDAECVMHATVRMEEELDFATTERTLRHLLEQPETRLRSPAARTIRRQAYQIVEALGTAPGKTTSGRIGDALHDHQWSEAMDLLEQWKEAPALGAMQRWIRDLFEPSSTEIADEATVCKLLFGILVCAGQSAFGTDDEDCIPGPMKVFPMWHSIPRREQEVSKVFIWDVPNVRVVSIESAWREGMTVWTTCDSEATILEDDDEGRPSRVRCQVPFVPGGFVLQNILSPKECQRIRAVADAMGFTPEASYSLSTISGAAPSTAADGVVWVASEHLNETLWQRVASLLPPELCHGALVHLNRRWRIYRYTTGTVYRPHIDGAWTGSGLDDKGVYQKDLYSGTVISRLTFLIYLNDNFEEGGTTFYAPAHETGCIAARSIAPRQGSILCFPHGPGVEHVGLVHEGSAVSKGTKYVLRTDVLYEKSRSSLLPERKEKATR
jgi:2OG-Fe(II) oxygenase superfamily